MQERRPNGPVWQWDQSPRARQWDPVVLGLGEAYMKMMMAFSQFLTYLAVDLFLALLLSANTASCIMETSRILSCPCCLGNDIVLLGRI